MIDIQVALSQTMILAGDLVICWRAWVLLPHDKFWRFVLAMLMICNIGLNIADLILTLVAGEDANTFDFLIQVLDWTYVALSWVVNLTATSLIGWKAW
ncbi:hypothetical protein BDP27DRAFT_1425770 [Rhodocollybia butyracea]|uniref:Uncharacterized protein n=1 Tax=Rhodocollybia butyracea TaxID=206335 RepID=A0A9P5PJP5_9AGAR|nr:hypothetical protein BDP27DRAFT_1425770 [Rhodocollybia butyracea]